MIITFSGDPGSGKSTIAKEIAAWLGYEYLSIGHFMRALAQEKNMTLLELHREAMKNTAIDTYLDNKQKELAGKNKIVLDSRLGFYFLPESIKIYLTVDEHVAAQRIYDNQREDEKGKSIEEIRKNLHQRKQMEWQRYKAYYGVDLENKTQFDLVLDTSQKTIPEILTLIKQFLEKKLHH
ncbi:MAG: cytidylate kinase family protein [Candidatus Woesearchaeota archaeon]